MSAVIDLDAEVRGRNGKVRTVRDILMEVDRANQIRCEGCGKESALIFCDACRKSEAAKGVRTDRRRNRRPVEEDCYLLEGADIMELDP